MGRRALMIAVMVIAGHVGFAEARERGIEELPKDVWNLAFVWTEPVKEVARESRRFDPVSGLWFGLLEGSIKSVERTTDFFFPADEQQPGTELKSGKPLLRYSF